MSKRRPASHLQKIARNRDKHATADQHRGGTARTPSTNSSGNELRMKTNPTTGEKTIREVKP